MFKDILVYLQSLHCDENIFLISIIVLILHQTNNC